MGAVSNVVKGGTMGRPQAVCVGGGGGWVTLVFNFLETFSLSPQTNEPMFAKFASNVYYMHKKLI